MSFLSVVELLITGNSTQAIHEVEKLATSVDASSKSMVSRLESVGKASLLIGGAIALGVGAASVKLASDFEQAQAQLQNSVKSTGQSWASVQPVIAAATKESAKFGESQTTVEKALSTGVTALGNISDAHLALQRAENMSASTGRDLSSSLLLVIKGMEGYSAPLRRAGIDLPIAAAGALKLSAANAALSKDLEKTQIAQDKYNLAVAQHGINSKQAAAAVKTLLDAEGSLAGAQQKVNEAQNAGLIIGGELDKRFGGSSAAAAETFDGKVKALRAELENIGIQIGLVLIPILERLGATIANVIQWFQKHRDVAIALGIVIGGVLVTAITAYTVSMIAAAAATIAATWPILAIVAAVALLAAGIIWFWTNWNQIWGWVQNHPAYGIILLILANIATGGILGIVIAVHYLSDHWHAVWSAISGALATAYAFILPALNQIGGLLDFIGGMVNWLLGVWNQAWGSMSGAISAASGAIAGIAGGIIGTINGVIGAVNALQGVLGSTVFSTGGGGSRVLSDAQLHQLGLRASGGPVAGGRPYIVGEKGPELFVPGQSGTIVPNGAGGGGTQVIQLVLDGRVLAEVVAQMSDPVANANRTWQRRNGQTVGTSTV